MLRTLLATFVLGTALAATNSTTNGVTLSLDTAVMQQFEEAYWAVIEERINAIAVPDLVLPSDD